MVKWQIWTYGNIFAPSFCMDCSPRVIFVLPLCVIQGRDMPVEAFSSFDFTYSLMAVIRGFPVLTNHSLAMNIFS